MKAIGVRRGSRRPELFEVPRPEPGEGEALVRTVRVGVDGTDHEVLAGSHGGVPAGEGYLVLGHEAVGVVADPNGTGLAAGDVVVPTVRRPPGSGSNEYFERGRADMAPPEATVERGIDGAHGFMSEYFVSHERYLVPIPRELAPLGFLVEPVSVSEKALELAYSTRSSFPWEPATALVLGNGSLGLLTVAMLVGEMDVYCLGRRDRPDPSIDFLEELGATYVDSREAPVEEVPAAYEPADLVYEATGYARHAIASVHALAPSGVVALLGLPGSRTFEVDGGRFHEALVLENKAIVGSINAAPRHFGAAAATLEELPASTLSKLVTTVAGVDEFETAFETDGETKTAVEFSRP